MAIQLKVKDMNFQGFAGKLSALPPANQDLQSYIEETSTLILEVEGQTIKASPYFVKRCPVFMKKLEGMDMSKVITLTDFSFPVYQAFITYLQTDNVNLEGGKEIELLTLAYAFGMEALRFKVLELLKSSINVANALQYYDVAAKHNDVELGLASLDFIKWRSAEFLRDTDVTTVDASIAGFLWRDLRAVGAFPGQRASASAPNPEVRAFNGPAFPSFNFGMDQLVHPQIATPNESFRIFGQRKKV